MSWLEIAARREEMVGHDGRSAGYYAVWLRHLASEVTAVALFNTDVIPESFRYQLEQLVLDVAVQQ